MVILSEYKEGDKLIPWKILAEFKGKELEGLHYEQLLPFEANSLQKLLNRSRPVQIHSG